MQPPTKDIKPKRESLDRKVTTAETSRRITEPLPKARQHVQDRMSQVIRGLFADKMTVEHASKYAGELEAALWSSFKEVLNGKEATGSRYK